MIIDLHIWDWLGIGLVFLVLEIFISGVFLFWVGLAAITVSMMLFIFPDTDWKIQCIIFAVITLLYVLGWAFFGRSRFNHQQQDELKDLNSRSMNYIGEIRPLSEAIVAGKGIVVIDDSRWVVRGPDLPEGALVEITGIKGTELIVQSKA